MDEVIIKVVIRLRLDTLKSGICQNNGTEFIEDKQKRNNSKACSSICLLY